jgi:Zn-dependent protease with chaperone function
MDRHHSSSPALVVALLVTAVALAANGRTVLKPGWNMFSPQQDVEVGQQISPDAERQLPMLNNSRLDNYVNTLGLRLAAKAQGEKYPYHFKVVNDQAINAFALPGGPIYVNRGVIEAADNESQLAGVIAHEIAHVALRHGTNQASKASAAQVPLAILGGVIGSQSTAAALAQLGASFAVNSVLLKYSRTAESQADILGTQILYDAGYDPRGMAQFFQKIEAEQRGRGPVEFFSNHPSPDNRIERVNQEVALLGAVRRDARTSSREFDQARRDLQSLPVAAASQVPTGGDRTRPVNDAPSGRFVIVENALLRLTHPDNWQAYGQGDAMTLTPRGGLVDDGQGHQALAYGVIVNIYDPPSDGYGRQLQGSGYGQGATQEAARRLDQTTDQLVQELRLSNRNMRVIRSRESIVVDGERALSTFLSNDSPIGGRETDWLVTVPHPDGLLFFVFVAPEQEFQRYEGTFHQMLRSVRINR